MAQKDMSMAPEAKDAKGKAIILTLSLVIVLLVGVAFYFYWQTVQFQRTPQNIAQQQLQNIVSKVSKLILLPQGETPTIATVTDPSLLKGQAFFANTQKGDEILIYTNAKEAILYRPSSNMIINVAPLNIGNTTTNTTTPATSGASTPATGTPANGTPVKNTTSSSTSTK